MASKINTTEYMYCSARLRALESSLFSAEKLRMLMDSSGLDEALSKLSELGVTTLTDSDGGVSVEDTLEGMYRDAWEQVISCVPCPENLDFLRYPYDCSNLKSVIKCHFRGISPESMLYNCGSRTRSQAMGAMQDASCYPTHMSLAVGQAAELYSKTKNPQSIDVILDNACYKDMLDCAKGSGCELSLELVRYKIDVTNILTCIRLIRMNMGQAGRAILESAVLEGGSFDDSFYVEAYDGGEDRLCELLAYSRYDKLIACLVDGDGGLSSVERYADDEYIQLAKTAKMIPFGPEVAIGYLVAVENQTKNLRIILDAKASGKSAEQTVGRLRCSYV